ncbi:hypothetical protein QWZ14_01650 [Paeniroseomonas aquatica]|uniref:Thioredoxin-like fold domain-containing protein n=1 Tax=Paeniroseomonas aquatica TaxID=373043 RepID=A0ABT8A031_9PROT|nr:hypothetical protein [Paeniroseomonas aquatica]MDN3563080.1 hypothetical protein [Paeniroseomonas aquatica]
MRRILLLATTILAAPMMGAVAQTCSLDAAAAPVDQTPVVAAAVQTPRISDEEIRSHQVLRRLASRGAILRDLGSEHGVRGILAQAPGGEAQTFYLLPDGMGVVAGMLWDVTNPDRNAWDATSRQVRPFLPAVRVQDRGPALQARGAALPPLTGVDDTVRPISGGAVTESPVLTYLASEGAALSDIGLDHGVRAVFGRTPTQFQTYYVTPDGRAVITGILWDLTAADPGRRNVTLRQTRSIPGVVPTVAIGTQAAAALQQQGQPAVEVERVQAVDGLSLLANAHVGVVGQAGAPIVYMVFDPLCPYSVRGMDELRPAIAAGQLQIALLPVAGLDNHNNGQSTLAARSLLSVPPEDMADAWTKVVQATRRRQSFGIGILTGSDVQLQDNKSIAVSLGVESFPTFVWRQPDGTAGTFVGSGGVQQILRAVGR